jgi:hypothetical protein
VQPIPQELGFLAATTIHHNLTLVTRNTKDMARIGVALFIHGQTKAIVCGDVLANAVEVQFAETTSIPVASLAGLAILKLFARLDRRDPRDVADLQRLMDRKTALPNAGGPDSYEASGRGLTVVTIRVLALL